MALLAPCATGAQGGEIPHPDHAPGLAWEGLQWQPTPDDRYLAEGALCVGNLEQYIGGPVPSGASILANWTLAPGPTGGAHTGHIVLGQAVSPPHDAQLCRKFSAIDYTVLGDEVRCEIQIFVNGSLYWGETLLWTVKVCGGPLEISVGQRADGSSNEQAASILTRERVYDPAVLGENWQRVPIGGKWPWY